MPAPHHALPTFRHRRWSLSLWLLALVLLVGCRDRADHPSSADMRQKTLAVTLCHGSVSDLLPRLALELGYFHEEGLNLTLRDLSDGRQAFEEMRRGQCNFAVSAAPPIVLQDPASANFTILATVMSDDDAARIIARRDRGITRPQDLRGKRIGIKRGIVGHLFLDLFLMKHGLAQQDITLVDLQPDDMPQALADGWIDAFSMTHKQVSNAARLLGDEARVFSEPGLNVVHGILTTRSDLPLNLQAAPRLLKALLRAETYLRQDPVASQAIIARAYGLSDQQVQEIWGRTAIEVALANSLFVTLEDQYRWQVERGFAVAFPAFPNYLDVVSPQYLRALKPEAVSVVKK